MSQDQIPGSVRRATAGHDLIPRPPPLPAPRPLQRARDAASRFLGYASRSTSPRGDRDDARFTHGSSQFTRSSSLGENNATASHKTGLEIKTLSINDRGSHAIIAGKEIFKTIRVEDGHCAEDFNLRMAIRSTPTLASGRLREVYSIDIADVAWAKGESANYVAAATSSGKIIVYDLGHAGLQAAQLHEHFRQVHNVTFNPHKGSLLLSGSQDGTVRLWDIRDVRSQASSIQSRRKFSGQSDGVRDVKWSPTEGVDFAFGTDNGEIQRWDLRNLKAAKVRVPAHGLACNAVDWHPDGKHILSASSDKTVRVFDVSTNRSKKALWEIRAPYPVMLARWRPSCQSVMPQDNGALQCTQIATAYDRRNPIVHVWDFRRPHLPFRELQPYAASPTDLLWHSQDLLWTVGDGTFLQTDIQHTAKVIDRRNLQALDVSPLGELAFVAQARHHRRTPKQQQAPALLAHNDGLGTSLESNFLSRSWTDDSLDHSFLSVMPSKHKNRSHSNSRTHDTLGSFSYTVNQSATIKLDDILMNRKSFRPQQFACRGQVQSLQNSHKCVMFLAEQCSKEVPPTTTEHDFLRQVEKTFKVNEDLAQSVGLLQTAQTWKMVSFCAQIHLRDRIAYHQNRILDKQHPMPVQKMVSSSIEKLAYQFAAQLMKSPVHSPGSLRPVSKITQQLAIPESTSGVPTPLARPSTSGKIQTSHTQRPLPDLDSEEKIALPPSLAAASAISSTPLTYEQPENVHRRLTAGNLEDLQRLESAQETPDRNDIVKRWSTQPRAPLSLDPVDDDGVKIPLSKLEHHGSGESFQFLEESAGSRGSSFPTSLDSAGSPTLQMVAEHPTRAGRMGVTESFSASVRDDQDTSGVAQSMFFQGSGTLADSLAASKELLGNTSMGVSDEHLTQGTKNIDINDFAFRQTEDPALVEKRSDDSIPTRAENASHLSDVFYQSTSFDRPPQQEAQHKLPSKVTEDIVSSVIASMPIESIVNELEDDLELNKPWSLIEMLRQLQGHYTSEQPYPQMASLLLLLMGPILPRTHPLPDAEIQQTIWSYANCFLNHLGWEPNDVPSLIQRSFEQPLKAGLQPLQVESVLSTYHEQLLAYQLFNEAASLRKLAYPAYPAVYEDFLQENTTHSNCGQCGRPIVSTGSSLRCESCRQPLRACAVCWEPRSPFTSDGNGVRTGSLFSACLLCGHTGHAACLNEWFISRGGDGCPTAGCLCDCVAGEWREEKLARAEQETEAKGHGRVRSDEWRAKESKAVEGVRLLV